MNRKLKCYVWSVLQYGAEAWTLKAAAINRIEAFEMWTFRWMLKISWTEHVRNADVLKDRELFEHIKNERSHTWGKLYGVINMNSNA
nr:unnamed protein product [Callosobruchus chinensis]